MLEDATGAGGGEGKMLFEVERESRAASSDFFSAAATHGVESTDRGGGGGGGGDVASKDGHEAACAGDTIHLHPLHCRDTGGDSPGPFQTRLLGSEPDVAGAGVESGGGEGGGEEEEMAEGCRVALSEEKRSAQGASMCTPIPLHMPTLFGAHMTTKPKRRDSGKWAREGGGGRRLRGGVGAAV